MIATAFGQDRSFAGGMKATEGVVSSHRLSSTEAAMPVSLQHCARARSTGPASDSRSSMAVGAFARTRTGNATRGVHDFGGHPAHSASAAPLAVHEVLRSPGQPLDPAARAFFESRYGLDFSRVRVHADRQAAESVRAVGAAAYAVGSQIAFAEDRYRPGTSEG